MKSRFPLTWKDYFTFSFSRRRMLFGYTCAWQNLRMITFLFGPFEFGIYFRHGKFYMPRAEREYLEDLRIKNVKG